MQRTDEFVDRFNNLRDGLHLEKSMVGHPENEEMPLVRMKLGDGLLLRIVRFH